MCMAKGKRQFVPVLFIAQPLGAILKKNAKFNYTILITN